jgi:DNA replication protein DnaC
MTEQDNVLQERLRRLGLWGVLARLPQWRDHPALSDLLAVEEEKRRQRSLRRRLMHARLGSFGALADFDWKWPKKIDRSLVEELLTLGFVDQGANVILVGPNGTGKTMIAKNLAYQAVLAGHGARCTTASEMLHELAAQDSTAGLTRRLRRYCRSTVLVVDEVGYLSYDSRYADLLFEVVNRRYQLHRPVILTTNKEFAAWREVFPNARSVVALIDRLVHRAEIVHIEGESYRFKEASERAARRKGARQKS